MRRKFECWRTAANSFHECNNDIRSLFHLTSVEFLTQKRNCGLFEVQAIALAYNTPSFGKESHPKSVTFHIIQVLQLSKGFHQISGRYFRSIMYHTPTGRYKIFQLIFNNYLPIFIYLHCICPSPIFNVLLQVSESSEQEG